MIVNELLSRYHRKKMEEMGEKQLKQYIRIIFILGESYYLEGNSKYQYLMDILQNQKDEGTKILLNYLNFGISFDENDRNKVQTLIDQTIELERNNQELQKLFYDP